MFFTQVCGIPERSQLHFWHDAHYAICAVKSRGRRRRYAAQYSALLTNSRRDIERRCVNMQKAAREFQNDLLRRPGQR